MIATLAVAAFCAWTTAVLLDWRDAALKPGSYTRAWVVAIATGLNRLRRRLAWTFAGLRLEATATWRDLDRWAQHAPAGLPTPRVEPVDARVYPFPTDRREAA